MDSLTLIVTALAAGAALGLTDTASSVVKDSYTGLKALVRKRLEGQSDAELVLIRYEQAPETWREPLIAALGQAEADRDVDLVVAAQTLLGLVDPGMRNGKYAVDARSAQGIQIGDRNRQANVFKVPHGLGQHFGRQQLSGASAARAVGVHSGWATSCGFMPQLGPGARDRRERAGDGIECGQSMVGGGV
jgi:hypothetical protein